MKRFDKKIDIFYFPSMTRGIGCFYLFEKIVSSSFNEKNAIINLKVGCLR